MEVKTSAINAVFENPMITTDRIATVLGVYAILRAAGFPSFLVSSVCTDMFAWAIDDADKFGRETEPAEEQTEVCMGVARDTVEKTPVDSRYEEYIRTPADDARISIHIGEHGNRHEVLNVSLRAFALLCGLQEEKRYEENKTG